MDGEQSAGCDRANVASDAVQIDQMITLTVVDSSGQSTTQNYYVTVQP